jgi:hypothetical protein
MPYFPMAGCQDKRWSFRVKTNEGIETWLMWLRVAGSQFYSGMRAAQVVAFSCSDLEMM